MHNLAPVVLWLMHVLGLQPKMHILPCKHHLILTWVDRLTVSIVPIFTICNCEQWHTKRWSLFMPPVFTISAIHHQCYSSSVLFTISAIHHQCYPPWISINVHDYFVMAWTHGEVMCMCDYAVDLNTVLDYMFDAYCMCMSWSSLLIIIITISSLK